LQEREDRITELDHGHRYALDSISRLEDNLHLREVELAEASQRIAKREAEAEELREQISTINRDHARIIDAQTRELQDLARREGEARQHQDTLVKEKAELDIPLVALKERSVVLQEEVDRLRRQVHELQQESADKEVKIVHLTKSRAQDKEDMAGLNIALDSKQQELELVCYTSFFSFVILTHHHRLRDVLASVEQQAVRQRNLPKSLIIVATPPPYLLLEFNDLRPQCPILKASEMACGLRHHPPLRWARVYQLSAKASASIPLLLPLR
jgi:hypothetical protein